MKQNLNNIILIAFALFCVNLYSQEQQVSSLLSNYGLGVKFSETTVSEKSQGDLSVVGNNNQEVVSYANPAMLAGLQLTSFSLSAQVLGAKVETVDSKFENAAISVSDVSLGIPMGKKGGIVLGLRLDSSIGFEIDGADFYNFANGSVNNVYLGVGYEVYKGLSLGVQYNRYFGKVDKRRADKEVLRSTVRDYEYNVEGASVKLGLQYKYSFSKAIEAHVGAYGILEYDNKAKGTLETFEGIEGTDNTFAPFSGSNIETNNVTGTERNPFKSVFGAGLGKENNWFVGVSYQSQDAIQYLGDVFQEQNNKNVPGVLDVDYESSNKLSIGGYIIPKKYALKNYFKRVVYRGGFKYENTGLVLNKESVKNLGISFGVGLPVGRRVSYANLSFELGRIGEKSKNNYQEEYFNVGINFSLSDKWFKKRVID